MTRDSRAPSSRLTSTPARSLLASSANLMASTALTSGLGYLFWIAAAHQATSAGVGSAAAVISLASVVAVFTYLGPSAVLIERLPAVDGTDQWMPLVLRAALGTASITFAVTVVAGAALRADARDTLVLGSLAGYVALCVGAAAWTVVSLLVSVFISARRPANILTLNGLVSGLKLALILPAVFTSFTSRSDGGLMIMLAWAISATVGAVVGLAVLLRRIGGPLTLGEGWSRPSRSGVSRMIGHHVTSSAGVLTPLMLPLIVTARLGPAANAHFYTTWMVGGVFFTISPSVAYAMFAETARRETDLARTVRLSLAVIAALLVLPIAVAALYGSWILDLFGHGYGAAGAGLLTILAFSAVPDALSNVAVAVMRVAGSLRIASTVNMLIAVVTLVGAWVLTPSRGILGAGDAWFAAQILGALITAPILARGVSGRARRRRPVRHRRGGDSPMAVSDLELGSASVQ